jgi:non-specific serine/threonine protein kinase/serine/threonine-protein kinase
MTPQRWQQVKELLGTALELEPVKRSSFLDNVCASDLTLREDVERLLAAEKEAGSEFLGDSAVAGEIAGDALEQTDQWIGRRIGPYQIVEEIGVGGMGKVFRAMRTDEQYQSEVAIKFVRAGPDAEFVIQRFKNERQILANLGHPNIARLLDGGTTEEGLPYVLMELVRGESIDAYCDKNRLSTADRLKLFLQVCSAVQYAHQRLIIHRDIKPANILVTREGMPKLLDFGIAKILESGATAGGLDPTVTLFRLLTPGYASPEQVRGEVITTASDVYSLGVVLYELLTGRSPYGVTKSTSHEMARAACEFEPEKPSLVVLQANWTASSYVAKLNRRETAGSVRDGSPEKLSKRLKGDLDNIALMALRKEPKRRYASVEQFAEDVRRHLANLPVVARKDTLGYRSSKFFSRHKAGVAAAAVVLRTLSAGFDSTWREPRMAKRRFSEERSLANSLMFDVHDSIKDLPGATPVRKMLVEKAQEYLDRLAREAAGDMSLQKELASAYERVGDVQGNPYYANLGDVEGALESYRKSLVIRQRLSSQNPRDTLLRRELASGYTKLGAALDGSKDFPGALLNYREALQILESLGKDETDARTQDQLAGAYYYVGIASAETGNLKEALDNAARGAAIREIIHSDDPATQTLIRTHLAGDYGSMAQILMSAGDSESSVAKQRMSLDLLRSLAEQNPSDQTIQAFVGEAEFYLGVGMEKTGPLDQALDHCGKAKDIFEALLKMDPKNAFAREYLGLAYEVSGRLQVSEGKPKPGVRALNKAILIFEGLKAKDPRNPETLTGFGESYWGMGRACSLLSRNARNRSERIEYLRQAHAWYEESFKVWQELEARGALDPLDQSKPEDLAKSIKECDVRLAKLTVRNH